MIDVRPFASLGKANFGWLNANHHFSFGHYIDPQRMAWGKLRVWNDDEIAPGKGFDPHPHRDMEIITYVREGAITHRDNMGNEGRTEAGDVQVMSAGTGVVHAEYNLEPGKTHAVPDLDHARPPRREAVLGAKQFPKEKREAGFDVLASGRPQDARQRRAADQRGWRGAGHHAEEGPDAGAGAGRRPRGLPGAGARRGHGERRWRPQARDGIAIRDEARIRHHRHRGCRAGDGGSRRGLTPPVTNLSLMNPPGAA